MDKPLPNNVQKNNKSWVVADCDEVLVRISPKWVHLMHEKENFDYFNNFFRLSKDFDIEKSAPVILSRPEFYIDKWLMRKDILENHTIEEIAQAKKRMMDLYNVPDYYDNLKPTSLGKSLSFAVKNPILERLVIVTRTTPESLATKERFLKELFRGSMNKVDIYYVETNEKKSDVIRNLGNKISSIYEDEISNIEDIVTNCNNLEYCQLFIPSYGYNVNVPTEIFDLAKKNKNKIIYYNDK